MKKIILLLAVLLMTAPALADAIITVTDAGDGSGWATIAYDANGASDFIRAFALDITADDANIVEIDSVSTVYWVFPGTIDINDAGGVNDVGSPIAPNGSPGALDGLDTSGITIEMGALFEAGVDPDPAAAGTLLRIRVDATSDVCVVGNAMRGKVVMKDASSHEPVSACAIVTVGGCACPGDITDTAGTGAPDGKVDIGEFNKILIAMMTAYPGFIDPTGEYNLGMPAGFECADITDTAGTGAPDGKIDIGEFNKILIQMMTVYPGFVDATGEYNIGCPF